MVTGHEAMEYSRIDLPQGTIRYRDIGSGEPIVFVHGVLVNGDLWTDVVPSLAENVRSIVPDLPLGGHAEPMNPDADCSPPGIAALLVDFLDALGLGSVTLVGNDTGGAICQIFVAEYPERVSRLVLTNCDAFRNFLPLLLRPLQYGAHLPGFTTLAVEAMRPWPVRKAVGGLLIKHIGSVPRERVDGFFDPALENREVRRDLRKLLTGISPTQTTAAAAAFPEFEKPVLLAWAPEDRLLFPVKYAIRLSELFPNARLELIEDSYAFISIDQPERLAELIAAFVGGTSAGD